MVFPNLEFKKLGMNGLRYLFSVSRRVGSAVSVSGNSLERVFPYGDGIDFGSRLATSSILGATPCAILGVNLDS